jgi:hypothetical protein
VSAQGREARKVDPERRVFVNRVPHDVGVQDDPISRDRHVDRWREYALRVFLKGHHATKSCTTASTSFDARSSARFEFVANLHEFFGVRDFCSASGGTATGIAKIASRVSSPVCNGPATAEVSPMT